MRSLDSSVFVDISVAALKCETEVRTNADVRMRGLVDQFYVNLKKKIKYTEARN